MSVHVTLRKSVPCITRQLQSQLFFKGLVSPLGMEVGKDSLASRLSHSSHLLKAVLLEICPKHLPRHLL